MPYTPVLIESSRNGITRSVCSNDEALADLLATALRAHPASPPRTCPAPSLALQGNLCEFATWDIGANTWRLFEKRWTWPANAMSPWKDSSGPGVDVPGLALDPTHVLVLTEVKSSDDHGANLVTGGGSSLQSDFQKLFGGDVDLRLNVHVGAIVSSLTIQHERPDLADRVKKAAGVAPSDCPQFRLVAVLMCNAGDADDVARRERAFGRLLADLVAAGWSPHQVQFRTVEVGSLDRVLSRVTREACR